MNTYQHPYSVKEWKGSHLRVYSVHRQSHDNLQVFFFNNGIFRMEMTFELFQTKSPIL